MMWYENKNNNDENNGIVLSTRVRLARNLKDTPFPMFMGANQKETAADKITNALCGDTSVLSKDLTVYTTDKMSGADKQALKEEHLISSELAGGQGGRAIVNSDGTISIMLMEEDHIRLQVINGGYDLEGAYKLADKVDDVIEENVEYAFDNTFGYLTSCPTNAGTGMRASVMLHLPALEMTGNISRVLESASNMGIAVRGLYGEGSKAVGGVYQFSNQTTMGAAEEDIIKRLKNITDQIIDLEKQARESLLKKNKAAVEDRLWRSYGVLRYARTMSSDEAKELLSDVMLGINMGIIESDINVLKLMVMSEPAQIVKAAGKEMSPKERDKARAEMIRNELEKSQ